MRYFELVLSKDFVDAPQIIDWFGKIDGEKIRNGEYDKIPFRTTLNIKENVNIDFTDIISFPFFSVSHKVFELIKLFEPNMKYREIFLMDKKGKYGEQYKIPQLELVEEINSVVVGDKVIFKMIRREQERIIIRLDLAEAMIRREIYCLGLTEVDTTEESARNGR